jgi:acyl-CoA dehydrogenase
MRSIGLAERSLESMIMRIDQRTAFSKKLSEHGSIKDTVGRCRIEIDAARLLVLRAAEMIDKVGAKRAQGEIAMAKVCFGAAWVTLVKRAC